MKRYSLFSDVCKKVICSMGRKACDVARNTLQNNPFLGPNCVTARYTDSC